jgi:hypothetical protein
MQERDPGTSEPPDPASARHSPVGDPGSDPAAAGFFASDLLSGQSPREILARLIEGDPFHVAERCTARLRDRALLIDTERLTLRSMARIAYAGFLHRADLPLHTLLTSCIDRAIEDLMREDREEERAQLLPVDHRYGFVSQALGIEPGLARRACIVFNSLPTPQREVAWAVMVERRSIELYAAEEHRPPDLVRTLLKDAILALSLLDLGEQDGQGGPARGR